MIVWRSSKSQSKLSLVVKPASDAKNFWNIALQWSEIVGFREKPSVDTFGTGILNTWVYLFRTTILPNKARNYKLETDFFPEYIVKNKWKAYFHNYDGEYYFCYPDGKTEWTSGNMSEAWNQCKKA